jgi:starvation-inducible DNA-binding protein
MSKTRIDIPEDNRAHLIGILNARLADAIDLGLAAKQAHWNVKGPSFYALHELFDKLAADLRDYSDEIAERVAQLGGRAEGTVQQIVKASVLQPYPAELTEGLGHVDALSHRVAALVQRMRLAIDRASELRDSVTADMFTGISAGLDKYLWMLDAHLDDGRKENPTTTRV